jgi:regulator of ribonuclease activity A
MQDQHDLWHLDFAGSPAYARCMAHEKGRWARMNDCQESWCAMKTADLVDTHDDDVRFCNLPFLRFGRKRSFFGPVQTVKCFEDNVLLKAELQKPGNGRVLVVDGGGSTRIAIMGDIIAGILIENKWAGIIINGSIRDSAEIDAMDIGARSLATTPKKSSKDGAGRVGVTVEFGGVRFEPGNWVYCDPDGILVSDRQLI